MIGGTEIYELLWGSIEEFHVTLLDRTFEKADTIFPMERLWKDFEVSSTEEEGVGSDLSRNHNNAPFSMHICHRKSA